MVISLLAIVILFALAYTLLRGAPYVPSHGAQLDGVFHNMRSLSSRDVLLDIGSGDGIVLRRALAHGAKRAIGIEINPLLVLLSRLLCLRAKGGADVVWSDFFHYTIPAEVTVVYVFGDRVHIAKIAEYLQRHVDDTGRVIDVISHGFELPDGQPSAMYNAYYLYTLRPLQAKKT